MKSRAHPIYLLALGAVVLRGLAEFFSLQRWRLLFTSFLVAARQHSPLDAAQAVGVSSASSIP